ncbi:hypothetical protein JVT61DRAFT_6408 [Boletus reticuloceps]|uniref:Uncharacterized protein n=1 Tax=Boletus reticuloceps TaxID=495285 RepID=A0A8I2YJL9_9AGAM|nr:hypothetical protein JVT61DRAFT_6408 [Boletus reticuloceps]
MNSHTLVHLICAINPGGQQNQVTNTSLTLTPAKINGQSSQPLDFLLDIVLSLSKMPAKRSALPFLQKGVSLTIFWVAFTEVSKMLVARGFDQSLVDNIVHQAFAHIFTVKGINHVPWSANPVQGQNGRPSSHIVHDTWLSLGTPSCTSSIKPNSSFLSANDANILLASQASADMSLKDCRADWSADDLHKTVLPVEWHLNSSSFAQSSSLTLNVYNWESHNFDFSKPPHALALFIAFVFSGLLPYVDHEKFTNKPSTFTGPQFMAYITGLGWENAKRKGVNEISPFITMVTAFIVTLGDSNCPDCNVFQKEKTSSHHGYSDKEIKEILSKHTSKGITLFNVFVCFKLANSHSLKVWKAAQWGVDITLKSQSQLADLWAEVENRLLEGKEFGGYNAVVFLACEKTARRLLEKEWVKTRGVVIPIPIGGSKPLSATSSSRFLQGSSTSSLGKRQHQHTELEILENDEDDDGIIDFDALARAGPSSRRRFH